MVLMRKMLTATFIFLKKLNISAGSKQFDFLLSSQYMDPVPGFSYGAVMSLKEQMNSVSHCISAVIA